MLDYKLIEALAFVVQENGFEKAALRLHVTQSAVSQRVKLLEEQTGQILLARTTPPRPTAAGRQIIRHYRRVKQLEDDLLDPLTEKGDHPYTTFAVGINADSLATWFMDAVALLLKEERLLLDVRVDDQDQTLELLKNGEVIGCISTQKRPVQGCRSDYLGQMVYRMVATPGFRDKWFESGVAPENISQVPLLVFNRSDMLHQLYFQKVLGHRPHLRTVHYLPSSEKFIDFIARGFACGMLPDQQSKPLLKSRRLVEIKRDCPIVVPLFWHCWNIQSRLLEKFSRHLALEAEKYL